MAGSDAGARRARVSVGGSCESLVTASGDAPVPPLSCSGGLVWRSPRPATRPCPRLPFNSTSLGPIPIAVPPLCIPGPFSAAGDGLYLLRGLLAIPSASLGTCLFPPKLPGHASFHLLFFLLPVLSIFPPLKRVEEMCQENSPEEWILKHS